MIKENKTPLSYAIVTLIVTAIIGFTLIQLFPNGNSTGASILFILMNLTPMMIAWLFFNITKENKQGASFLSAAFQSKDNVLAYIMVLIIPILYYGISLLLQNVKFTGQNILTVLTYLPWTILQGGLEEVGWRWYLQRRLKISSFFFKMIVISIIWFLWHIPIYMIPWITSGSSNYIIFYLMILGNTFTLGVLREKSNSALPCILAHMLIDTLAVVMLLQSNLLPIMILVFIEIIVSLFEHHCLQFDYSVFEGENYK